MKTKTVKKKFKGITRENIDDAIRALEEPKKGFLYIPGTVFPYDILVCLGTTKQDIIKYMDDKFENALTDKERTNLEIRGHGLAARLENNTYILWLKEFPTAYNDADYLAHEIFHVADLMLRKAGLELCDESDETWAYLIGYITKKIYTEFKLNFS